MKKTYETPVLTTEQFDVDDVITASAPGAGTSRTVDSVGETWQIPGLTVDWA